MKGFTNTTKMRSGHGFATGGTINRVATGGTINRYKKGGRPGYAEGGKVGGLDEHESDMNGHSAVQRSESSTQELAEHGGKTPLTAGYAGGGKAEKHFHVHNHYHNGKKMPTKKAMHKAEGGSAKKNWIAGATKNKGALHRALNVPEGKKIPQAKLSKAEHSKNPTMRKRANLAETLGHLRKAAGGHIHDDTKVIAPDYATGGTINRLAAGGAMYAGGGKVHEDAAQDKKLIKQEISRTRLKAP